MRLMFLPNKNKKYGGVSESQRVKNIAKMSKDEYIKKYNDGTHDSKVTLENEWEKNKK